MKKRKWKQEEIYSYKKEKSQFLYYNKEDSNIFIFRESGLGFSPNWANPWSWIIVICIIIFIVLLSFVNKMI
jgi:uncharacterized membrane protein